MAATAIATQAFEGLHSDYDPKDPKDPQKKLDEITTVCLEIFKRHIESKMNELAEKELKTPAEILAKNLSKIIRPSFLITPTKKEYRINILIGKDSKFQFVIYYYPNHHLKMSYLSEIEIEEGLLGQGIASSLMQAYKECLHTLDINIDYLHVLSETTFTAQIYSAAGYEFSKATEELLSKEHSGGIKAFLEDSSSSRKIATRTGDPIEMLKVFSLPKEFPEGGADPKTSIQDFQKYLESQ